MQKENFQLKNQTEKQSFLLKEQKRSIELLQQKKDIEQIQTSQLSKQDKAVLEKRIDGYLKEVNMCLSLLNKE